MEDQLAHQPVEPTPTSPPAAAVPERSFITSVHEMNELTKVFINSAMQTVAEAGSPKNAGAYAPLMPAPDTHNLGVLHANLLKKLDQTWARVQKAMPEYDYTPPQPRAITPPTIALPSPATPHPRTARVSGSGPATPPAFGLRVLSDARGPLTRWREKLQERAQEEKILGPTILIADQVLARLTAATGLLDDILAQHMDKPLPKVQGFLLKAMVGNFLMLNLNKYPKNSQLHKVEHGYWATLWNFLMQEAKLIELKEYFIEGGEGRGYFQPQEGAPADHFLHVWEKNYPALPSAPPLNGTQTAILMQLRHRLGALALDDSTEYLIAEIGRMLILRNHHGVPVPVLEKIREFEIYPFWSPQLQRHVDSIIQSPHAPIAIDSAMLEKLSSIFGEETAAGTEPAAPNSQKTEG